MNWAIILVLLWVVRHGECLDCNRIDGAEVTQVITGDNPHSNIKSFNSEAIDVCTQGDGYIVAFDSSAKFECSQSGAKVEYKIYKNTTNCTNPTNIETLQVTSTNFECNRYTCPYITSTSPEPLNTSNPQCDQVIPDFYRSSSLILDTCIVQSAGGSRLLTCSATDTLSYEIYSTSDCIGHSTIVTINKGCNPLFGQVFEFKCTPSVTTTSNPTTTDQTSTSSATTDQISTRLTTTDQISSSTTTDQIGTSSTTVPTQTTTDEITTRFTTTGGVLFCAVKDEYSWTNGDGNGSGCEWCLCEDVGQKVCSLILGIKNWKSTEKDFFLEYVCPNINDKDGNQCAFGNIDVKADDEITGCNCDAFECNNVYVNTGNANTFGIFVGAVVVMIMTFLWVFF